MKCATFQVISIDAHRMQGSIRCAFLFQAPWPWVHKEEQTLHTYLLTAILVVTAMGGMVSSQMCANQDWGNMHCTGGKNRWKCTNED